MKRGFTLVELLAVIIIIGIVFSVTFPLITNNIKNSEEKAYNFQIQQIKEATKDLIIKKNIVIPNNETGITIYLSELKSNGLLPIEMTNPKTKKTISNTSTVLITKEGNSYKYEVNILDLNNETTTSQNENAPVIRLNGNYIEYIEVNTEYLEQGAKAYSSNGNELEIQIPQIQCESGNTSLDTSKFDTCKINYSVTDNGYTTTIIRTVVIRDTISPIIVVPDIDTFSVSEINGFDVKEGVYAIDNSNEDISVYVESSLTNVVGQHLIVYTATDSSNNQAILKRIINVVE